MKDNETIARIREGDQGVTSQIYQRYRQEFIRWMQKKYHCSEDDAREMYQCAFFAFYNQIKSGKLTHITASIKTYLFGIGKNKLHEQQRSNVRYEYSIDEEKVSNYDEDATRKQEKEIQYRQIEQALQQLDPPHRQMLIMVYYENRSMEYIANKLGYKNAASTKNQKYKCMKRIREMLETTKKVD
ncbi:MAG: RNA polymerase sigma factor [Cyclobacteriaceae bacterium]